MKIVLNAFIVVDKAECFERLKLQSALIDILCKTVQYGSYFQPMAVSLLRFVRICLTYSLLGKKT